MQDLPLISVSFASVGGVVALTLALAGYWNRWLQWQGWKARLASGVVAYALTYIGIWWQVGIFEGVTWLWGIGYGILLAAAAWGFFGVAWVKDLLVILQARQPSIQRHAEQRSTETV